MGKILEANLGFLEYLSDGVLVLDKDRVILAANPAFIKMFGFQAAEIAGQTCYSLFNCQHPPEDASECDALCSLANLEPSPYTLLNSGPLDMNGQVVYIEGRIVPFAIAEFGFDPAGKFSLLILKNNTAAFHQQKLQTEFVAAASHQLRTPLASIKTAVGLLIDQTGPDFHPLLRKLLENIKVSGLRLERIVNDLIELTNLQSGRVRLDFRPVAVSRLIEQTVDSSQERLETRQQNLQLDLPPEIDTLYVEADFHRICQVLGHLLSNASKFSQPGRRIDLKVYRREDQNVIFSVKDEGTGIPLDEQPFIFEKFYQVQSVVNSTELGGGLGLPQARALIELHGGKLWLDSAPGQGSTFSFSLPQAVSPDLNIERELDGK